MLYFLFSLSGVVLLCLLEAVFADHSFNWDGPGHVAPVTPPNTGSGYITSVSAYILICTALTKCIYVHLCSECSMDTGSCGCCLMQQKLHRLKTYFNETLDTLKKEILQTKQSFDIIESE